VTEVDVNADFDDVLFHPTIPTDTKVYDSTTARTYRQGESLNPTEQDKPQLWLAWLVGAAVAAACVWMIVRTWKQLRGRE
jgi:hypothetical protein